MNKYEMLCLIDSQAEDEKKDAVIARIEGVIAQFDGKVLSAEKLGVKKLAYPIKYKTDALFTLITFEAQPACISELERVCNISDEIVRRIITKVK